MTDTSDKSWAGKAALAGAAIGSAAIAAALLFASRRKERAARAKENESNTVYFPPLPNDKPESD